MKPEPTMPISTISTHDPLFVFACERERAAQHARDTPESYHTTIHTLPAPTDAPMDALTDAPTDALTDAPTDAHDDDDHSGAPRADGRSGAFANAAPDDG